MATPDSWISGTPPPTRLLRVGDVGSERPVLMDQAGDAFDLRPFTGEIDGEFLERGGLMLARKAATEGRLPHTAIDGQRIGAPLARPGQLFCIGLNYAEHAVESGIPTPTEPVVVPKSPYTIIGPYDTALIPPESEKTDWEVELGVVVGQRARYLPDPEQARRCIAGFVASNDVSERELQFGDEGGQWAKGKSCETFNPLGPWLVPIDEVNVPPTLRLWVNGEIRQCSSAADMVFSAAQIVYRLSQYLVLEPGDVINSGTPAGVAHSGRFPYLAEGDLVELEISQLGRQRTRFERASR